MEKKKVKKQVVICEIQFSGFLGIFSPGSFGAFVSEPGVFSPSFRFA